MNNTTGTGTLKAATMFTNSGTIITEQPLKMTVQQTAIKTFG